MLSNVGLIPRMQTKFQWSGMLDMSAQPRCTMQQHLPVHARTQAVRQYDDGSTNRLSLGAHSHYDVSVASCPLTCGIADGIFPEPLVDPSL